MLFETEVKQKNGSKLIGEMKQVYSTYLDIISNSDSAFFNQWHLEHLLGVVSFQNSVGIYGFYPLWNRIAE